MLRGATASARAIARHRGIEDRGVERLHEERHRHEPRQQLARCAGRRRGFFGAGTHGLQLLRSLQKRLRRRQRLLAAVAHRRGALRAIAVRPAHAPACRRPRTPVPRPPARRGRCGWRGCRATCASSRRKCAVASPSTVGLVARISSRTPPSASIASSSRAPSSSGPDAIQRRQMSHQHEVVAAIAARELNRHHIGGRFHHAQQRRIALRRRADRTQLTLR